MAGRRILILTNRVPYPLRDGGALAMHATITGYYKAGWEVFVLAMNTTRHFVQEQDLPRWLKDDVHFAAVKTDTRIRPLPVLANFLFSRQPEHAARFYNASFKARLRAVIKAFAPEVIQMESIYLASYLPSIRAATNAPVIQRLHNVEYQVWERLAAETANRLKQFYLRNLAARIKKYELKVWNDFDLLLPITRADADIIRATGCTTPMLVTPFGIDTKKYTPPINAHEQWNGYHIGAMDWLPNEEAIRWLATDIWPDLHRAVPEFSFYFAGRNMPGWCMQLQAEGLYCMGEVPDADVFIADKKILLVPLRSGGGIRVKILEAMAAGKLVISTATGMQGIDATDGVHYLKADTKAAFIQSVKWCLEHRQEATFMAEQGRGLVMNHYSNDIIAGQVTARLVQLL